MDVSNWRSQIRKGLLEYGLLNLIRSLKRAYGLQILQALSSEGLHISEGTLYPLLSRLVREKILSAKWQTENTSGHPRKYYELSKLGEDLLLSMNQEWNQIVKSIDSLRGGTNEPRTQ